jgi:hypothetical protein
MNFVDHCVLNQIQQVRYACLAAVFIALLLGSNAFAKTLGTFGRTSLGVTIPSAPIGYAGTITLTNDKLIVEDASNHLTNLTELENEVAFGGDTSGIFGGITTFSNQRFIILDNEIGGSNLSGFTLSTNGIPVVYPVTGELNLGGVVNISDLNTIISQLPQPAFDWTQSNFGDGIVNISELNILVANWQAGIGQTLSVTTPEPNSLTLLTISSLLLVQRRKF